MKQFEYEATILSVDEANRVMTVFYTSPGRMDIPCGVALPESADDLGDAIHAAVPFGIWHEQERSVFVPQIGTVVKGTVRFGELPAPEEDPVSLSLPFSQADRLAGRGQGAPQTPTHGGFPTRYVGAEKSAQEHKEDDAAPAVIL